MARKLRVEYGGAIYHVMNRGDRREPIFKDDPDHQRFLETLGEASVKTGWQVHAYCLMGNHFHLVVETPQPNLVVGMKWFLGTYTSRFNRRHRLSGHLFSGRYKALMVDGSGNGYLRTVCDYVHLNPVRAELLRPEQALREFAWSSLGEYLKAPSQRVAWLRVDRLFGEMGIPKDSASGRRRFEEAMEERRSQELEGEFNGVRRGWCFGNESFRKELLEQMHERVGAHHYGEERHESALERAERIVSEELRRRGVTHDELSQRRKGDRAKVEIAMRLRAETAMTLKWIAQRLQMGSVAYVNNRLFLARQENLGE
jgi:putative transposase